MASLRIGGIQRACRWARTRRGPGDGGLLPFSPELAPRFSRRGERETKGVQKGRTSVRDDGEGDGSSRVLPIDPLDPGDPVPLSEPSGSARSRGARGSAGDRGWWMLFEDFLGRSRRPHPLPAGFLPSNPFVRLHWSGLGVVGAGELTRGMHLSQCGAFEAGRGGRVRNEGCPARRTRPFRPPPSAAAIKRHRRRSACICTTSGRCCCSRGLEANLSRRSRV